MRQPPTIPAKAPPGQGRKGRVKPSSPVTSLLGLEGGCDNHRPQPRAGAGPLQALLLQESSQGDLDHCQGSAGGTGVIKEVKGAVQRAVFWSCWRIHVSLRGWSHLRKAGFTQDRVSPSHESPKEEYSMCKNLRQRGKLFFK